MCELTPTDTNTHHDTTQRIHRPPRPLSPPKTTQQGHSYCQACLCAWRTRSPTCPECRRPALHSNTTSSSTTASSSDAPLVRNLGLERLILRLPVRCSHTAPTTNTTTTVGAATAAVCEWTGPLEALGEHRDKHCAHRRVACRLGCGWIGRGAEEEAHVRQACARFERQCRFGCGQTFDLAPQTPRSSDPEAPSPPHPAERHYRDACPRAPVPCPFARFGCEARPVRGELAAHHAEAAEAHAGLCGRAVERLKEEGREKSRVRFWGVGAFWCDLFFWGLGGSVYGEDPCLCI